MDQPTGYKRDETGEQPPYLHPEYRSTVLRAPKRPLVPLPHTLSEITGPVYGHEKVGPLDHDLTRQHDGEPLGERVIVLGRVMDSDGRPVPDALTEIWQANVEGTRNVLEAARAVGSAPRLVFTSTMGAFGGDYVREPVGDFTKQSPQTTYGVSKSIGELLVNDYARKGFVDARAARLATVIVRAGKPNMALSSYASAVIREPLSGIDYVCPVAAETSMPMIGYETCVGCLIRMAELDGDEIGPDRTVNVPGLSASVTEMLAALHRVAGDRSLGKVTIDADPLVAKVTSGWPRDTDNRRSAQLGLPKDRNVDEIIQTYIGDYVDG